jgi:branched-chain amino acid transport system permease protein/urea transport system permease protein
VPLAIAVCGVLGWVVERWLVRPLYQRPFDTLVVTWGLSLLLRKCAEAMFGLGYKSLTEPIGGTTEVFGATYPRFRLVLIGVSIVVFGALVVWYRRSRTGTRIQAMVGNPDLARALGIPVTRYAAATFVVGTCLAGLAGVMIAPLVPVQPFMGLDHILMSFFVLVVGGLGSVGGLVTGSALIGGTNSIVSALSDSTGGYFCVLALAILFLWLRPRGIHAR